MRNLPNLITIARLCLITPALGILFVWAFVAYYGFDPAPTDYLPADLSVPRVGVVSMVPLIGLLLTVLGWATDALDGFLAKTFGWESVWGAKYDPLADKWFTYTGFLIVPLWHGWGWYIVWIAVLGTCIHIYSVIVTRMRRDGKILCANQWARRKSGVLFFAQFTMMCGMAFPAYATHSLWIAFFATLVGAVLCLVALSQYWEEIAENERGKGVVFPDKLPASQPVSAPAGENIVPFKRKADAA